MSALPNLQSRMLDTLLAGGGLDELSRLAAEAAAAHALHTAGVEVGGALCARHPEGRRAPILAVLAEHAPGAARTERDGWLHAILPPVADPLGVTRRLHAAGVVAGAVAARPGDDATALLREARVVAELVAAGDATPGHAATGTWRLLTRAAVRTPGEVAELATAAFGDDDVTPAAAEQLRTFAAYVANDCNMNATAAALPAHRHTVAYRLERLRDATGLDPLVAEDREQLGVAVKARAVLRALRRS